MKLLLITLPRAKNHVRFPLQGVLEGSQSSLCNSLSIHVLRFVFVLQLSMPELSRMLQPLSMHCMVPILISGAFSPADQAWFPLVDELSWTRAQVGAARYMKPEGFLYEQAIS